MPLRHLADTKENLFGEDITIQGFRFPQKIFKHSIQHTKSILTILDSDWQICLLTKMYNPKTNTKGPLADMQRAAKYLNHPTPMFRVKSHKATLCLLASTLLLRVSLHRTSSTPFFTFLCFLLVIWLLKCPPRVVLKGYLVFPSARWALQRKIRVLGRLHSGTSCGVVGCESDGNKSIMYIK